MGLITLHFLISKQCSWRDREPRREEFTCRKISSTSPKSDKNVNTLTQPLIKNDCHNHTYHSRRTLVWIEHKQRDVLHMFSKGRKGWMMGSPAHPSRSRGRIPPLLLMGCSFTTLSCTMVTACPAWAVCSQEMNHVHVPFFWLRLEQTSFPLCLTWPDSRRVAGCSSLAALCITSAPAAVLSCSSTQPGVWICPPFPPKV